MLEGSQEAWVPAWAPIPGLTCLSDLGSLYFSLSLF